MGQEDRPDQVGQALVKPARQLSPLHLVVRDWVVRQYRARMGEKGGWLALKGRHLPGQVPSWQGRLPSPEAEGFATFDVDALVGELLECAEADAEAHRDEPGATGFWVYYLHSHVGDSATPDAMTSFKVYRELPAPELAPPGRAPSQFASGESETQVRQIQVHLENRDKIGLSERALHVQAEQALLHSYQQALSRHEAREAAHFAEMRYAADRRNELEMVLFHESQENQKNRQLGAHLADVVSKFVQLWTANEMLKKQGKGVG